LAQATLASPLSKASQEARSPFLKSEAFRLLSLLFATKPDPNGSDLEKAAAKGIQEVREEFLTSIESALEDVEMRKAKRVRGVLKALEKFVHCLSSPCSKETLENLEKIQTLIIKLGESESNAVKSACTKLTDEIDTKVSELKAEGADNAKKRQSIEDPSSETKKSKKKKKKKKK
jgi:hypothetical protein